MSRPRPRLLSDRGAALLMAPCVVVAAIAHLAHANLIAFLAALAAGVLTMGRPS